MSYIHTDSHNYNAVLARISARQEGCCGFCAERINNNDTIISKAHTTRSKYLHKKCAERINLL
jgi:hypothetical protein